MPYPVSPVQALQMAEQRWHQTAERMPQLAGAVALQRRLLRHTLGLMETIDRTHPATIGLAPAEAERKLRQGLPMLRGEVVTVDGAALKPFLLAFCEDLASGEAGAPASRLHPRLQRDEVDTASLVAASVCRQQEAIRVKSTHLGIAADLLWLVAELTSSPVAHGLSAAWVNQLPARHSVRALLGSWPDGFCPVCGSWPAFSERRRGDTPERWLRCSFCGSAWKPPIPRCLYCREAGDTFVTAAIDPSESTHQVELCRECGGYVKSIAVEDETPFCLIPVEDLATHDLDLGAADRGYIRPPMPVFEVDDAPPCPPPVD